MPVGDSDVSIVDMFDVELLWLAVKLVSCDEVVEATLSDDAVVVNPVVTRGESEAIVNSCASRVDCGTCVSEGAAEAPLVRTEGPPLGLVEGKFVVDDLKGHGVFIVDEELLISVGVVALCVIVEEPRVVGTMLAILVVVAGLLFSMNAVNITGTVAVVGPALII